MSRPKLSHRAEVALASTMERLVRALPEGAAERVGAAAGAAVYSPLGIRKKVVLDNLRLAFPEQPEEWIDSVARAAFRHLGREAVAMMRLPTLGAAGIRERTFPAEWDEFEAALERGRGVILATGHFGNWEIAAAAVAARGVPMAAVVRRQGNGLFDARLDALRRSLGVETISQRDAPRAVPRWLRKGGVVGLVADQDARGSGVFVPFFGRAASTHRGPALFALRLGAPLFACSAVRLPGEEPRYHLSSVPVEVERTGELDADVERLTAEFTARLEAAVRAHPEQYFWFHRRWKSAPPPEPAPVGSGTTMPSGA
jgi:KDO2-lipid IV(A) lauroyltransferase